VARPARVRLRAAPPPQPQHYNGLAGSVYSYNKINGSLSVKLGNGSYVVIASGKCLKAEETQRFNNLIPAENQRLSYG
jgi:hypothetical protein